VESQVKCPTATRWVGCLVACAENTIGPGIWDSHQRSYESCFHSGVSYFSRNGVGVGVGVCWYGVASIYECNILLVRQSHTRGSEYLLFSSDSTTRPRFLHCCASGWRCLTSDSSKNTVRRDLLGKKDERDVTFNIINCNDSYAAAIAKPRHYHLCNRPTF
jgi:hypothetical protein